MRRGLLQDYANTACQMFFGWRSFDDVPRLLEVGDGIVEINLLTVETFVNDAHVEPLHICHEINLWLLERLAAEQLGPDSLDTAQLTVSFSARDSAGRSAAHTQRRLRFDCRSVIAMDGKSYSGVLADDQVGVQKDGGPWVMY